MATVPEPPGLRQIPIRHRAGEWQDPEVGRGDLHETPQADGHVTCGDFKNWFWTYLSESEDRQKLGKPGHQSYEGMKALLLTKSKPAYRAFVAMAEMRSTLLEVAMDMGCSVRTVQRLLDTAKGLGLEWKPIRSGCSAPAETGDELRVMGMLEPVMEGLPLRGYSVAEIALLRNESEDQVRHHIRRAREKRKGRGKFQV